MVVSDCVRVLVELAIPCERPGPRVFEGFTIGFHPRSWEIVRDCAMLSDLYYFGIVKGKMYSVKRKEKQLHLMNL